MRTPAAIAQSVLRDAALRAPPLARLSAGASASGPHQRRRGGAGERRSRLASAEETCMRLSHPASPARASTPAFAVELLRRCARRGAQRETQEEGAPKSRELRGRHVVARSRGGDLRRSPAFAGARLEAGAAKARASESPYPANLFQGGGWIDGRQGQMTKCRVASGFRHFSTGHSGTVGRALLRSLKLNGVGSYDPQVCVEDAFPPNALSAGEAAASPSGACRYRLVLDGDAVKSPRGRDLLLPSRDLAFVLAAEQLALREDLRRCVAAHPVAGGSPRSALSAPSAPSVLSSGEAVSEQARGNADSPVPQGEKGIDLKQRQEQLLVQNARLQRFIKERPFALRQPVSSIVFTAADLIEENLQETAATLASLLHGDTALSREDGAEEEAEGSDRFSSLSSCASAAPLSGALAPSSASAHSSLASGGGAGAESFSSASSFLRERLCGTWRDEVRRREEEILEKHVRSFESRRCAGKPLQRSRGLCLAQQDSEVIQRLGAFYASCSPLYLAALQAAAMQLRSLILADELLHSLHCGVKHGVDARRSARMSQNGVVEEQSAREAEGLPAGRHTSRRMAETVSYFWEAANIEAEEQQRRCGHVEGVHDVEKAEALLWLHAATVVATFSSL
ncbi:hypothetical protein BESB_013520 [Besnoitia besnoiti]|uniref:Uncharacterized protein n=1 Tax=Besnoitia besnoiti TaxID=94643 RepID=A0A2A9MBH1_BESBE|nr:hypothetical protein BESB_013520 [Besnoitia besnoiti]PFH32740.1 hypothetical protein BESB_013520 [Besnoitia besnoiti]